MLANGINNWKGNGDTALLFSLKRLVILYQERREMEQFSSILFQSLDLLTSSILINQSIIVNVFKEIKRLLQSDWLLYFYALLSKEPWAAAKKYLK